MQLLSELNRSQHITTMKFVLLSVLSIGLISLVWAADIRVTDGDTIRIGSERIRIVGLDAPEMNGKCREERRLAQRAKEALQIELASGQVEIVRQGKDRYKRTLARVYVDDRDVSSSLIAKGLARPYLGGKRGGWCS